MPHRRPDRGLLRRHRGRLAAAPCWCSRSAFLKSFAYAGVAVAALAGLFSVTVLPALLAVLGPRIDALAIRNTRSTEAGGGGRLVPRRQRGDAPPDPDRHRRRRSCCCSSAPRSCTSSSACPTTGSCLPTPDAARSPPTSSATSSPRARPAPPRSSPRTSAIRPHRSSPPPSTPTPPAVAARRTSPGSTRRTGVYADGAEVLDSIPFLVDRFARAPTRTYLSRRARRRAELARRRGLGRRHPRRRPPPSTCRSTGTVGPAGRLQGRRCSPPAAGAGRSSPPITFVLLFLLFGSVVVPLKALVLNVLSLSATFGAMVWVFQEGHFSGLLGFTAIGQHRRHGADPDVLHRLRAVDGLRGLPAVPHQGGVRPHGRQRAGRGRRAGADRTHRHRRRRAHRGRLPRPSPPATSGSSSCSGSAWPWPS